MDLCGLPSCIEFSLVECVITDPALIKEFFLIFTPGIIIDPGPIKTPSSILFLFMYFVFFDTF